MFASLRLHGGASSEHPSSGRQLQNEVTARLAINVMFNKFVEWLPAGSATDATQFGQTALVAHITMCDSAIERQSTTPEHHDKNQPTRHPYSRTVFGDRPNTSSRAPRDRAL